jgi:hypothetical protein
MPPEVEAVLTRDHEKEIHPSLLNAYHIYKDNQSCVLFDAVSPGRTFDMDAVYSNDENADFSDPSINEMTYVDLGDRNPIKPDTYQ